MMYTYSTMALPTPLANLLTVFESFESLAKGRQFHIIPPNVPVNNLPSWMSVYVTIQSQYRDFVSYTLSKHL